MSARQADEHRINPLPGVPDAESPFFDDLFAHKSAPQEWYDAALSLRRQGYAVIDFPDPDFEIVMSMENTDFDRKFLSTFPTACAMVTKA